MADPPRFSKDVVSSVDPYDLIRIDVNLPSLPTIYVQINESINRPNSSAKDIGEVISKDTTLSSAYENR
jgi:hypothetical protein